MPRKAAPAGAGPESGEPMITVVGHTAIDHISRVTALPGPNGSTSVTERRIFFGGGAANIAAGIARLGGEAELLAKSADPSSGWRLIDESNTTTEDGVVRLVKHRPAPGRRSAAAVEGPAEEGSD